MSGPRNDSGTRSRVEAVLALLTGLLAGSTVLWPEWIELFGLDPDHRDGSAEWLVVAGLLAVSLAFATVARLEWRRTALPDR